MRGRDRDYFSEWLSRTLAERKISGGEAAKALGVNDSVISRWRNGKASPSLESALSLAAFLEIEPPIAVAVTAGLMTEEQAGVERLPLPEEHEDRELARQHILKIPGLTEESRRLLLSTLDELESS